MKKHALLLGSLVCLLAINNFGQDIKNNPPQGRNPYDVPLSVSRQNSQRERMDRQHGRDKDGFIIQPPAARKPVRPITEEQRESLENFEITRRRLQAPAEYYQKYDAFLKNNKTGLARLFVDRSCDNGKTISVSELERCGDFIPVKGGGSYYSFRVRNNNGYVKDWWDIHFADAKLKGGNDLVQTIIANIGDAALETLNSDSKAFKFLEDYKAKATLEEIKAQNAILEKGITVNNFTYTNAVLADLNSTYVLRSIAYRLENEMPASVNLLNSANRVFMTGRGMDIMLAFKIVGREKDGSLILLWKELRTNLPRKQLK